MRGPGLEGERNVLKDSLAAARERHAQEAAAAQQVAIKVESQRSTLATLRTSLDRASEQSRQCWSAARTSSASSRMARRRSPGWSASCRSSWSSGSRWNASSATRGVRSRKRTPSVRELDVERQKAEGAAESARAALAEISLGMQETRVRRESLVEQFAATAVRPRAGDDRAAGGCDGPSPGTSSSRR